MKRCVLILGLLVCAGFFPQRANAWSLAASGGTCCSGTWPQSITLSFTSGALVVVHISAVNSVPPVTSLLDCSGSSGCGSSTDTLAAGIPCTSLNGGNGGVCTYYVCSTALSGTGTVTLNESAGGGGWDSWDVEVWTGGASSSCLGTTGTAGNSTANPSVATSGSIAASGELLTGQAEDLSALTAGLTSIYHSGGGVDYLTEYTTNPTSGSAATATWTATSERWVSSVEAWKPSGGGPPPCTPTLTLLGVGRCG